MWRNTVPDSYRVGQKASLQNIQDGGMACLQVKAAVDDAIVISGWRSPRQTPLCRRRSSASLRSPCESLLLSSVMLCQCLRVLQGCLCSFSA